MPSIADGLRVTPKGQLSYSRVLDTDRLKDDLDQLSSPPLSYPHKETRSSGSFHEDLRNSLDDSLGLNSSSEIQDFNDNSCSKAKSNINPNSQPELKADLKSSKSLHRSKSVVHSLSILDEEQEKDDSWEVSDVFETSLPVLARSPITKDVPPTPRKKKASSCPVSPLFGITTAAILEEEAMWDSFAQLCLLKRSVQFGDHERALSHVLRSKREEADRRVQRMVESRDNRVRRKEEECKAKALSKLEQMKADHQEHYQKLESKQKEIAQRKQQLEDEERRRQEAEVNRLKELIVLFGEVQANRNMFVQTLEGCEVKDKLPEVMEKYRIVLDNICSSMTTQLTACRAGTPVTDDQLTKARTNKDKSEKVVVTLKQHIGELVEKCKNEEQKKQIELKKKEEEEKVAAAAAQDLRVQSLAFVLKEWQAKASLLTTTEKAVQAFTANADKKKFRFDLQRAVNTPINAISPVDGAHLRDKLQRLLRLLSGQPVEVTGRQVSINGSPDGSVFCQNLVAKMLVKKGEEQVTSNHESAFAIAAVVVGLWTQFPAVGQLFEAHMQAACPYVLPLYATRAEGQTTEAYHRAKGYKISDDGSVEEQDKFLHRMSGLMNLYCACMVTPTPKGSPNPHPLGLHHAWNWLARTLNMEPQPDVTAGVLYDLLKVTGHFLFNMYKGQFVKMLRTVYTHFLPKLKAVSVTPSTVGRLEIFLENSLTNGGRIEPPKGLLPLNFLTS